MSLRVEHYKLVSRQYLYRLLDQLKEDFDCFNCKYCIRLKTIRSELRKMVLTGGELVRHQQI